MAFLTRLRSLGGHLLFWRKSSKPQEIQTPIQNQQEQIVSVPNLRPYHPLDLSLLKKTQGVKGRWDYDTSELVWITFQTETGQIIKEFGIINDKVGDQYIIKLLINDPNDIAVVSVYAITGAGLA